MASPIRQYLREVDSIRGRGDATEHTYRPAFKALVEALCPGATATNEPRRVACGAPDFIVSRDELPIGHIECKDVGANLDQIEKTEQFRRYLEGLDNLILTDYLEFRYYVGGEPEMRVILGHLDPNDKLRPLQGAEDQLRPLFSAFLSAEGTPIGTPKDLAARMASIAKIIRNAIELAFGVEGEAGTLHSELESFRLTILSDITPRQFADMYAQTVCYGMFSARINMPDAEVARFSRQSAVYALPPTNPFLREIFEYIAGTKLDSSIVWAVDLLAAILRRCDMHAILADFGRAAQKEDPVVHFYETFLAAYDPTLREKRGVYYTPEPVVSFIVRSVDEILKRDFALPAGLADNSKVAIEVPDPAAKGGKRRQDVHRVQILDPATGTGTFLYETVKHIFGSLQGMRGAWAGEQGYVAQHLLPRLYGFELMMAPYAVAHLKLGWLLRETGYNFPNDERLRVYLTNTLEESEVVSGPLLALANQIAREANAAGKVKTEAPIMVVMGNPPYSGHTANPGQWSKDLIREKLPGPDGAPGYFECDGQPLGERNPKWLNDDYVKFIRFAQRRIEQTGYGILAFITNHGYLDNPTFRGMRRSLMHTFDDIHVLDLHGNAKKRETAPDGSKDENVFDIMQGVAICLMVRKPGRVTGEDRAKTARVFHAEIWGDRKGKGNWLFDHQTNKTRWTPTRPATPFYLFKARNAKAAKEFECCLPITQVFPTNVLGFQTHRDHFSVDTALSALRERIRRMRDAAIADADLAAQYRLTDSGDWQLATARRLLKENLRWEDSLQACLYRPLDYRYCFFSPVTVDRPRKELMQHVVGRGNLCLGIGRQGLAVNDPVWSLVTCSRAPIDANVFTRGGIAICPLYLYPNGDNPLFAAWPAGKDGRRPNLDPKFVDEFAGKVGLKFISDGPGDRKKTFGPEDIFQYAYAVFHCPTYRSRYAEFLKIDFPRLPLTTDRKLFARLCELGEQLAGLHMLQRVPAPAAKYPKAGDNIVDKPRYKPPTDEAPGRVYVNNAQYFEPVEPAVWDFHVGGYQVAEKWLKDRKGRTLGFDDIETYRKITEAVRQTIRLMTEIDATIISWPIM